MALAGPAQAQRRSAPDFHRFLQGLFAEDRAAAGDARYVAALADLNGDRRPEVVVYLSGSYYCGSGGCHMYVFTPSGRSWRQVARTTVTRTPIRLLNSRSRGWRDLSVAVAGGGLSRREVLLAFNGRRYPGNPTVAPARMLRQSPPGRVLIADTAVGRRLFD
jgi:putative lipoprotein